jgi:hypothetical protein
LIWFRKEPNVRWLSGAGEQVEIQRETVELVREFLNRP